MRRVVTWLTVPALALPLAAAASCGGAKPKPSDPSPADPVLATLAAPEWTTEPGPASDPEALPPAPVRVVSPVSEGESRWQVRRLGAAPAAPLARPRPVGRQDIWFNRARLDNAFRLLSDAGRFNIVIQGDLSQLVTAELCDVEPYDAMLALAEAQGVHVRYRGNIVIVTAE